MRFGPLELLGIRCTPTQISGRRMLWVESFWRAVEPVADDLRIQFRAMPMRSTHMPPWGESMDHDPCDWMWPTSRWQPGRIHRDRYGLRPPASSLLRSDVLQLEVRVVGSARPARLGEESEETVPAPEWPARRLPVWCGLRASQVALPLPERPAPVLFALRPGASATPEPVWTAEALQRITHGQWLVEPPPGWLARSVVRGPKHMELLPAPALFVASDYETLAAHERYSRPRSTVNWDRHLLLPGLQDQLAGAIVQHPVEGLASDFPLLQVEDPIRALLRLGAAARERYRGLLVGVTGTVGKSSTIAMLRDLLPAQARVHTTIDNYNSRVGVPAMLASLGPDVDVCILEMAQSSLWMDRGPISLMARPHVAIVTEIGLSQTRQAVSVEQTAEYKSRIFLGLEPGGVAIVPDHIPCLLPVVQAAARTAGAVWVVGPGPQADVRVLGIEPEGHGCRVRIALRGRTHSYLFPVASEGLVRNSTLSFAALVAMGFDPEAACARMPGVRLPASVMQVHALRTGNGVQATLIDDSWNAEVMSMRNAMAFVRDYGRGNGATPVARRIAMLGRIVNLDHESEAMHRSLAAPLLASGIEHVVTHGQEMRWLREEMPAAMLGPHFESAAEAAGYLGAFLRDGDLLLVKGDRDRSDFGDIPELLQKL